MLYDKPVKTLMHDFAQERLRAGQIFTKQNAVGWFAERYPKVKRGTVLIHVDAMSTNAASERKHHKPVRPGSGHDLFFKLGKNQYRLWDPQSDPPPVYAESDAAPAPEFGDGTSETDEESFEADREFAFEADLRDYLARNLALLEPELRLYDEEGVSGLEFPAGGRFIDILAIDRKGCFVVIELKVSRGYDRTIGQLLRYMGWIRANLSPDADVRGVIVASSISDDLRIAASLVPNVALTEYSLQLDIRPIDQTALSPSR